MRVLNISEGWQKRPISIINDWYCENADKNEVMGIIADLSKMDKALIESYPNLEFIASCTTGLDHIDINCCRNKGIKIISLSREHCSCADEGKHITKFLAEETHATAEHTWALILSLIRKVPFAHNDVCAGNWEREKWQGTELSGKNLGIVGYGRVGRQVARIAEGFGMEVIAYDTNCRFKTFEFVLGMSDIITVHVPLTEETRGMFAIEQFKLMKPSAYFINTSRGSVVKTDDLIVALATNEIAGAAIDVIEQEPYPPLHWVKKMPSNLIVTPHLGGNTAESREKTQCFIAQKIKDFITGGG